MSVHVYPVREERDHDLESTDCACDPYIEWLDDETGLPYEDGPLVIHECFDSDVRAEMLDELNGGES